MSGRLQGPDKSEEVNSNEQTPNLQPYYEALWESHSDGKSRDRLFDDELITYFATPIFSKNNRPCEHPFSSTRRKVVFLTAGSGYGKSTLIDMILLSSIFTHLYTVNSPKISEISKGKKDEYVAIRKDLLGEQSPEYIPVYINSADINSVGSLADLVDITKEDSIIQLAEKNRIVGFPDIIAYAEKNSKLLFLIEALDEVNKAKLGAYLEAITKLFRNYPSAYTIITSRSLGASVLPFDHEALQINKLSDASISLIVNAIATDNASEVLDIIQNHPWLKQLSRNPFMLQSFLKKWSGDLSANAFLRQIVDDIIGRRWRMQENDYNITIYATRIKILLGFLACHYIWGDHETVRDITFVRATFHKALEDLAEPLGLSETSIDDIESLLISLPVRSGILNIVQNPSNEQFEFQEELIMCWLAANCICTYIKSTTTLIQRDMFNNHNMIDRFFKDYLNQSSLVPSDKSIIALIFAIDIVGNRRRNTLLSYIIQYYMEAASPDEKEKIKLLFDDIYRKKYGMLEIEPNMKNNIENLFSINPQDVE